MGTIELIGMGLGAMGSTDFTKLLFLLSIAQRLEWRGQTQKDGGSNPSKVEFLNLIAENKPGQHSVDRPPSLLVANRYGPTIVRTNVQTLKGDFDQPENFWGPLFMGPCWLSFQCPECSLYSIAPLAFTSGGHY